MRRVKVRRSPIPKASIEDFAMIQHETTQLLTPAGARGKMIPKVALLLAGLLLAGVAVHRVVDRREEEVRLARWTDQRAIPNVALLTPHRDASPREFTLPGKVAAYYDATVHAQVSGYIKEWRKDIGAVVKKGEVLAVIETPELDEQIAQAREELSKAKATQSLADLTAQRWSALRSTSAVSKQASDEKESDSSVKRADVGAANARLERLTAQKAFAELIAPFDGIVTARNIDIGAFVGPSEDDKPLFKVADIHAIRVYVSAPQIYAARMRQGMAATLVLAQHPGRTFNATIATTANAIEQQSRTLLVQLAAENPDLALLPGAYADVRFSLPPQDDACLRIPASALLVGREGMRVATLGADNRVHFKQIAVSEDLGAEIEVASGLSPDDRVINNPGDMLGEGDEVRVSAPAEAEKTTGAGHETTR
jgi:RND family efflux transporter MFP subunit